jgi:phage terminase small subunit
MKNNSGVSQSPPKHLRAETAAWFKHLVGEYDFESHHIRLLTKACEAFDRSEQAREAIAKYGMTYLDRFNAPRARPECAIERDSRLAFARLVRELGIDVAQPADTRPPALRANR